VLFGSEIEERTVRRKLSSGRGRITGHRPADRVTRPFAVGPRTSGLSWQADTQLDDLAIRSASANEEFR
jgi:hypothetical protein